MAGHIFFIIFLLVEAVNLTQKGEDPRHQEQLLSILLQKLQIRNMGYLLGFLLAVYVAGSFKYKDVFPYNFSEFFKNYFKLILAVSFIYIFGLLWLGFIVGWDKPIYKIGAEPFLLAESFKILILSLLAGKISKIKKII